MKNSIKVLSAAFAALFIMACASGDSPEAVAKQFLNAVKDGNYEEAKEYSSEDTKEDVEALKNGPRPNEGKEFNVLNVQDRTDSTATVVYQWEGGEERQLNMVKENDAWKVRFSKEMDDVDLNQLLQEGETVDEGAKEEMPTEVDTADAL